MLLFCCFAECCYGEYHNVECHYGKCHCADCHYAECHYGKCHYAKCRGAICRYHLLIKAGLFCPISFDGQYYKTFCKFNLSFTNEIGLTDSGKYLL